MSVTKLRESTQKKGCMITVWVIMVLCLIGLTLSGFLGFSCANKDQEGQTNQAAEVFSVDGQAVTQGQIEAEIESLHSRIGPSPNPLADIQFTILAVTSLVDRSLKANMAAARGVVVDDSFALTSTSNQLDAYITSFRSQAVAAQELKANATEADFQALFKKAHGVSTTEFKEQQLQKLKDGLEDSSKRQGILNVFAETALEQSFVASAQTTEDEVKQSFEKRTFQTITFDKQDLSLAERQAQAAKAMEDLRGGTDFSAVQKKNVSKSDEKPTDYPTTTILQDPALKPLATLKVGEYSEPIVEFGGIPRIYKVTAIKTELPADFATNKAIYSEDVRKQKGSKQMYDALVEARKTAKIDWKSKGYEALYRVAMFNQDRDLSPTEMKTQLRAIVEETVDDPSDPAGSQPAIFARYSAMQSLMYQSSEEEKKELAPLKVQVLLDFLSIAEYVPVRLELVDAYEQAGDNENAGEMLLMAAENNTGFDPENQSDFDAINLKLNALQTAKKITDEKANAIRTVLVQWSLDKAENDRIQKEAEEQDDPFALPDPAKEAANKALDEANKPKEKTKATTGKGN